MIEHEFHAGDSIVYKSTANPNPQRYQFVATEPYKKADKTEVIVSVWTAPCFVCSVSFRVFSMEIERTEEGELKFVASPCRTCPEHRGTIPRRGPGASWVTVRGAAGMVDGKFRPVRINRNGTIGIGIPYLRDSWKLGPQDFMCIGAVVRERPRDKKAQQYWVYDGECLRCGRDWLQEVETGRRPRRICDTCPVSFKAGGRKLGSWKSYRPYRRPRLKTYRAAHDQS